MVKLSDFISVVDLDGKTIDRTTETIARIRAEQVAAEASGGYANGQRFRPRHPYERHLKFSVRASEYVKIDPPPKDAPIEEQEAYAENCECDMIFYVGDYNQLLKLDSAYNEQHLRETVAFITRRFQRELETYLIAYMTQTRYAEYGKPQQWENDPYERATGKSAKSEGSRAIPDGTGAGDQPGVEGDGGVRRGSDGTDGREREEG